MKTNSKSNEQAKKKLQKAFKELENLGIIKMVHDKTKPDGVHISLNEPLIKSMQRNSNKQLTIEEQIILNNSQRAN